MRRADSFEKTLMLGGIEGRRRRGLQRMRWVGLHHQLNGPEFGWAPEVGVGQGGLVCCNSWGHKESDTTERLNWTDWKGHKFYTFRIYSYSFPDSKDFHMIVSPQKFPRNLHNTLCIQGKILAQGLWCKCHPLKRFNQITSCWLLLLRIY